MILKDGTDTRDEVRRPGKFLDGMAVVLDRVTLDGTWDETQGDAFDGALGVRLGRRVLWVDSQGFMASERYSDDETASESLCLAFPFVDDEELTEEWLSAIDNVRQTYFGA